MHKKLTLVALVLLFATAVMVVTKRATGSPPPDFKKADVKIEIV